MTILTFTEAVIACAAGKKVEARWHGADFWDHMRLDSHWDSASQEYRLAEPEPEPDTTSAPGHNPANVPLAAFTDGRRPLNVEEFAWINSKTNSWRIDNLDLEVWCKTIHQFQPRGIRACLLSTSSTYATRKPPGFYLPKPKRTVPCQGLEDYPRGTLVKHRGCQRVAMVTDWIEEGIVASGCLVKWDRCSRFYLRSLDGGATWIPCTKEVEG